MDDSKADKDSRDRAAVFLDGYRDVFGCGFHREGYRVVGWIWESSFSGDKSAPRYFLNEEWGNLSMAGFRHVAVYQSQATWRPSCRTRGNSELETSERQRWRTVELVRGAHGKIDFQNCASKSMTSVDDLHGQENLGES